VNLSDEGLMPVAMVAFGAFVTLAGISVACAVVGAAFGALMVWAVARVGR
jgi:hypothetical protein